MVAKYSALLWIALWPGLAMGQAWSGILDPSRAYDWTSGVGFSIPAYSTPCATQPSLTAGSGNAAANTTSINGSIASCDATHNVVNLPAGTYYVNAWTWGNGSPGKSNVVVRGAGPNSTYLYNVLSAGCYGYASAGFCMGGNALFAQSANALPGHANVCSFTGTNGTVGTYTQGATSIILNSCGGGTAFFTNQLLVLDQQDDSSDTGGVWLCSSFNTTSPFCQLNSHGSGSNADGRIISSAQYSEQQMTRVTSVSGTGTGPYTVTISPGLYFNNFRSGQTPGAWWATSNITLDGLENLTLDHEDNFATVNCAGTTTVTATAGSAFTAGMILSGGGGATNNGYIFIGGVLYTVSAFTDSTHVTLSSSCPTQTGSLAAWNDGANATIGGLIIWCYQCWVKNVRSINGLVDHVDMISDLQPVVRDSYWFGNQHSGSSSYNIQMLEVSGGLVENNIMQNTTSPDIKDAVTGNVVGYNFTPKITFGNYLQGIYGSHNSGSMFNLFEGNSTTDFLGDNVWGTSDLMTIFRNQANGWQPGYTNQTMPIILNNGVRGANIIGNVLGEPGFHTQYEVFPTAAQTVVHDFVAGGSTTAGGGTASVSIYEIGTVDSVGFGNCIASVNCDPVAHTSLFRWGNYDTLTAAVTWNSGESSPGSVAYVNANSTPASHTLPNSFYLTSRPTWFRGVSFPAYGPDVTSGTTGICAGGTYAGVQATASGQCAGGTLTASAWGGHANVNPAQDCYLNVMNGAPDGSGSVLSFDANVCYSGQWNTGSGSGTFTWGLGGSSLCGPPSYLCSSTSTSTIQTPTSPLFTGATCLNSIAYDTSLNASPVDPSLCASDSTVLGGHSPSATPSGGDGDYITSCTGRSDTTASCANATLYYITAQFGGAQYVAGVKLLPSFRVVAPFPATTGAGTHPTPAGAGTWLHRDPTTFYYEAANGADPTLYKVVYSWDGVDGHSPTFTNTALVDLGASCPYPSGTSFGETWNGSNNIDITDTIFSYGSGNVVGVSGLTATTSSGSPNFTVSGGTLATNGTLVGAQIKINAITYIISSVTDSTHGVLTTNFPDSSCNSGCASSIPGGQGTGHYAVAYHFSGPYCVVYDTYAGTTTCSGTGCPTTGSIDITCTGVRIHDTRANLDGSFLKISGASSQGASAGCGSQEMFWSLGTPTHVVPCTANLSGDGALCGGGHDAIGYHKAAILSNPAIAVFTPENANSGSALPILGNIPNVSGGICENHYGWTYSASGDATPLVGATAGNNFSSSGTASTYTTPLQNEVWGIITSGAAAGTLHRFAHTFALGPGNGVGCGNSNTGPFDNIFTAQYAIGAPSQDGRLFIYNSSNLGELGTGGCQATHSCTDIDGNVASAEIVVRLD